MEMQINMYIFAIIITLLIVYYMKSNIEPFTTANSVGSVFQNPNAIDNEHPLGPDDNSINPYRSELSYGVVLQDPFIRKDDNTIPLIYYNRHLTEQNLQDIDYVPRRIRPPKGPVFWEKNDNSPLKSIFNNDNVPMETRWHLMRKLNMPSTFH